MNTIYNLTLIGSNGSIHTPIESFSYQFEKRKWRTNLIGDTNIREVEPVNSPLGGEFSIVKMTDGRSEKIINANAGSKHEFSLATIIMKTGKSSLTLKFFKVTPFRRSKTAGKDTITFSYETANIPKIDLETLMWKLIR